MQIGDYRLNDLEDDFGVRVRVTFVSDTRQYHAYGLINGRYVIGSTGLTPEMALQSLSEAAGGAILLSTEVEWLQALKDAPASVLRQYIAQEQERQFDELDEDGVRH